MTWWLAQNVVVTAALALVVAVACRLLRIGPVARHALWVLVLIKFITPPLVVWPWPIPAADLFSTNPANSGLGPHGAAGPASVLSRGATEPAPPPSVPGSSGPADHLIPAAPTQPFDWLPGMLLLGIAGSLFFVSLEGARILRLRQRVSRGSAAEPSLERRVRRLAEGMGVGHVPIRVIDGLASPMIWAAGRPQLLWPADLPPDATDACIDGLIVHELAHLRRRDHIVGWIELAAGVLWWWNPLFWFVRASRREQAELACDAWVISVLPNGRRAYAESLLALSGAAVRGAPSMAVVGIRATSRRVLERRLVMIMKGSTPLRLPVMGIAALAFVAAMTLPAWAMSTQQPAVVAAQTPSAQTQTPPPPPPAVVPPAPQGQAAKPSEKPAPAKAVAVAPQIIAVVPPPGQREVSVAVQPSIALALPSREITVSIPQGAPPPPPPAPAVAGKTRAPLPKGEVVALVSRTASLPAEGQQLVQKFYGDREQIQNDANTRIEARRQSMIKELEALQDQLTKAGKLDEAIAVRNYLRAVKGPVAR